MKKKIIIFVHTEYHLILAINQILGIYNNPELYDIELFIRRHVGGKRLTQELDFSGLPVNAQYFKEEVDINKKLSRAARIAIEELKEKNPAVFIFFQEMDPLMAILAVHYSRNSTEVCLYQDGLKPYVHVKFHSLGLIKHFHKQNLWMKKNGFPVESWLLPIWSQKYAYLKSTQKLYLTFPEAYKNWNKKKLEKIEMIPIPELNQALKKVFHWDDALLPEREKIIFYLNQPMHDDGVDEFRLLIAFQELFPENKIYMKSHPHITKNKIELYKKLKNVEIIDSPIPAELFIMNLYDSIIISMISTAMFLNNPENKYFYHYKLLENDLKRFRRYKICNPAPHIMAVEKLEDIAF